MMKTEHKRLCILGRSTDAPCPFPATESLPHRFGGDEAHLCAFHAAISPLTEEVNQLAISLTLVRAYIKAVRRQPEALQLLTILERAEADLAERDRLVRKVLYDLRKSELKLMR